MRAVIAESWALTLWTFLMVNETEEIARVRGEGERLDMAGLVAVAFHQPEELRVLDRKWRERAKLVHVLSEREAIDRGKRMAARILKNGELQ